MPLFIVSGCRPGMTIQMILPGMTQNIESTDVLVSEIVLHKGNVSLDEVFQLLKDLIRHALGFDGLQHDLPQSNAVAGDQ